MESNLPVLYVQAGSSACEAARTFLDGHGISHREIDVDHSPDGREAMRRITGHAKPPVLDWHGDFLADFDVKQLADFLHEHDVVLEDS